MERLQVYCVALKTEEDFRKDPVFSWVMLVDQFQPTTCIMKRVGQPFMCCCCHYKRPECPHIMELKNQLQKVGEFSGMMPDDYKYFSLEMDDIRFNITFLAALFENLVERKMEHIYRVLRNRQAFLEGVRNHDEDIERVAEAEALKFEDFYKPLPVESKIKFLLKTSWTLEEESQDTSLLIWKSSSLFELWKEQFLGYGLMYTSIKAWYLKVRTDLEGIIQEMIPAYVNYKNSYDEMLNDSREGTVYTKVQSAFDDFDKSTVKEEEVLEEVKDLDLGDDSPV